MTCLYALRPPSQRRASAFAKASADKSPCVPERKRSAGYVMGWRLLCFSDLPTRLTAMADCARERRKPGF